MEGYRITCADFRPTATISLLGQARATVEETRRLAAEYTYVAQVAADLEAEKRAAYVAGEGEGMEHIVKPCKKCGQPLEIKRNRETGEEFFGCSAWPACTYTEQLPEAIKLRRAGVKDMFDDATN